MAALLIFGAKIIRTNDNTNYFYPQSVNKGVFCYKIAIKLYIGCKFDHL